MKRSLILVVVALSLVAVACGQSEADPTTTTVAQDEPTTSVAQSSTTAGTQPPPDTTTTTSTAESTTTTTAPVTCRAIDTLVVSTTPLLTYIDNGYLWVSLPDETVCIGEMPERLAGLDFSWAPAGDKVLFSDGSVVARDAERAPVDGVPSSLGWTRPTGTSTVHVTEDGGLFKVGALSGEDAQLTPLARHDAIAYHPDGTTFAVSGNDGLEDGIWIAKNDGTDPQEFAFADIGVRIPEMTFTADARWLVFVADHTADQFDDGYHLHSVYTEPFEFEDGTLALNTASEFGATTHFISDTPLDSIVIPATGSGVSDVPDVIAVAQGACGPDRRALLGIGHEDAPVTLMDVPSRPIGFLSVDDTTATVVVAASDDGCHGPWDLHEVIVDLETGDTAASAAVADVDAAAVHAVLPTVDITLSGVLIEPFA